LRSGPAGFFRRNSDLSKPRKPFSRPFADAHRPEMSRFAIYALDSGIEFVMASRKIRGRLRHDLDTFWD
jgi:hypothetical protein